MVVWWDPGQFLKFQDPFLLTDGAALCPSQAIPKASIETEHIVIVAKEICLGKSSNLMLEGNHF